jgi:ribosomal protein S18 acetylase RimI-like enzyme
MEIARVTRASFDDAALSALLIDAVEGGASVGFVGPLKAEEARAYWRGVREELDRGLLLLAAREGERLVGAVQLAPAQKRNGRHRAEVQKLLVLREFRGRGVGETLMRAIEDEARRLGRWLLVLDTATSAAERLYRKLGYQRAGAIPEFAESSAGGFDATVLYYKRLPRQA